MSPLIIVLIVVACIAVYSASVGLLFVTLPSKWFVDDELHAMCCFAWPAALLLWLIMRPAKGVMALARSRERRRRVVDAVAAEARAAAKMPTAKVVKDRP